MKKPKPTASAIMSALIKQVMRATPAGQNEHVVTTYISRGMWIQFLVGTGVPPREAKKLFPDQVSINTYKAKRVFGSKTILIESPELFSWSMCPKAHPKPKPKKQR